jgi:hypothetical protein
MEKEMIEVVLGLAAIGIILVGGFLFARKSERAAHSKTHHHS